MKATEEELKAIEGLEPKLGSAVFFYNMEKRFPNNTISMYSNDMNAKVYSGEFVWGWESEERKEEREH